MTSTTRLSVEDRNGKVTCDDDVDTKLQNQVALGVREMRVIAEWIYPDTGELYLWFVLPK